jgi:hypothetical protein
MKVAVDTQYVPISSTVALSAPHALFADPAQPVAALLVFVTESLSVPMSSKPI